MTTNNVQLPTESMIVAGFEAVSMFHDTDAYKQMTGCQGAAESARVCWAAMIAEMPAGETPRQDVAPSDAAILSTRAEAAWARYGDEADIEFGRNLLSRFGLAAMPANPWQPIETAPKNTEVLVWREDSGPFIAKFTDPYEVITVEEMERDGLEFPDNYEEWWSDAHGWQEGSERPTHWMPLPPAPSVQQAVSQDAEDTARYRAIRQAAGSNDQKFIDAMTEYAEKNFADFGNPTANEFDAAVDYARRRIEGERK